MEKWQIADIFSVNSRPKLTLPSPKTPGTARLEPRSRQVLFPKLAGWLQKTARRMADVAALF